MPGRLDIALQRNETWATNWNAVDDAGNAIDLTGCFLALQVRDKVNQSLISSAAIEITDAASGQFDVVLDASEGTPLAAYGNPIQTAVLPFDLRMVDSEGVKTVLAAGDINLSRGDTVSDATYVSFVDDGAYVGGDNIVYLDDGART